MLLQIDFVNLKNWINGRTVDTKTLKFNGDDRTYCCGTMNNAYCYFLIGIYSYVRNTMGVSEIDEIELEYSSKDLSTSELNDYLYKDYSLTIEKLEEFGIYLNDLNSPHRSSDGNKNPICFYVSQRTETNCEELIARFNGKLKFLYIDPPKEVIRRIPDTLGIERSRSSINDLLGILYVNDVTSMISVTQDYNCPFILNNINESVLIDSKFIESMLTRLKINYGSKVTINEESLDYLFDNIINSIHQRSPEMREKIKNLWVQSANISYDGKSKTTCKEIVSKVCSSFEDVTISTNLTDFCVTKEYFIAIVKILIYLSSIVKFHILYWDYPGLIEWIYKLNSERIFLNSVAISKEMCERFVYLLASSVQICSPMGVYYPYNTMGVDKLTGRILSGEGSSVCSQLDTMVNRNFLCVAEKLSKKVIKKESEYQGSDIIHSEYYYGFASSHLDMPGIDNTIYLCELDNFENIGMPCIGGYLQADKIALNEDIRLCESFELKSFKDYKVIDSVEYLIERYSTLSKFNLDVNDGKNNNVLSLIGYLTALCKLCSCKFTNLKRIVNLSDIILVECDKKIYIGMSKYKSNGIVYSIIPYATEWMWDSTPDEAHPMSEYDTKYVYPLYCQSKVYIINHYAYKLPEYITNIQKDLYNDKGISIGRVGSIRNLPFLNNTSLISVYRYYMGEVLENTLTNYVYNSLKDLNSELLNMVMSYYVLTTDAVLERRSQYVNYGELESIGYTARRWFNADFADLLVSIFNIKASALTGKSVSIVKKLCNEI